MPGPNSRALLFLVVVLIGCGGHRSDRDSVEAMYRGYLLELDELEGRPHLEVESVDLRESWARRLVEAGERAPPDEKSHHLGRASLVLLNLYYFTEDEEYLRRAWSQSLVAIRSLESPSRAEQVHSALLVAEQALPADLGVRGLITLLEEAAASVEHSEVRACFVRTLADLYAGIGEFETIEALRRTDASHLGPNDDAYLAELLKRPTEPAIGSPSGAFFERVSPELAELVAVRHDRWLAVMFSTERCGACKRWKMEARARALSDEIDVAVMLFVEDPGEEKGAASATAPIPGTRHLTLPRGQSGEMPFDTTAFPRIFLVDPGGIIRAKDVWPTVIQGIVAATGSG